MRHRCTTHGPGSSEPVLQGPAGAVAAIRLSSPPAAGPAVVMLMCDSSHRLLLSVVADGATAAAVPSLVTLALEVAAPAGVSGIVLGVVRERLGSYLPRPEVAALRGVGARCAAGGVDLLDLLMVGPRGWRSVHHLAGGGEGDDHGHQ
ncbi:MAG: hypothetical protein AB1673_05885 [Actinomycetota bacterium]